MLKKNIHQNRNVLKALLVLLTWSNRSSPLLVLLSGKSGSWGGESCPVRPTLGGLHGLAGLLTYSVVSGVIGILCTVLGGGLGTSSIQGYSASWGGCQAQYSLNTVTR